MKHLAILAAVAALAVALPAAHDAFAKNHADKPGKVNLCHNLKFVGKRVTDEPCDLPDGTAGVLVWHVFEGKVINVSASSVPAHMAHGDVPAPAAASPGDTCRHRVPRCMPR